MTAPILYIEDEEDYQILVQRILKRAGLDVRIADTAEEGLKALRCDRPRLLILDINLPDRDGYSICQELRRDPAWLDLSILMLTVRRRPEEWLRGFSTGANDYMSKPLNPPELIERVIHGLERKTQSITAHGSAEYSLVQAAVAGNRAAFEILIQKYKGRLMDNLKQHLKNKGHAEDVAAQVFSVAFENLSQFRGEASFYTWVYRIAMNEVIGPYRTLLSTVSLDELADGEESHLLAASFSQKPLDHLIADREIHRQALNALDQVQEPYRRILELFFLQDLSYDVIAKTLRIPQGTVMSRLHKARKLLQDAWRIKRAAGALNP